MKLKDYKYEIPGTETDKVYKDVSYHAIWILVRFPLLIIALCTVSAWIGEIKTITYAWQVGMTITCVVIAILLFVFRKHFKL